MESTCKVLVWASVYCTTPCPLMRWSRNPSLLFFTTKDGFTYSNVSPAFQAKKHQELRFRQSWSAVVGGDVRVPCVAVAAHGLCSLHLKWGRDCRSWYGRVEHSLKLLQWGEPAILSVLWHAITIDKNIFGVPSVRWSGCNGIRINWPWASRGNFGNWRINCAALTFVFTFLDYDL